MAQIDIDKFVISLRRCFGEDKGIATTLDRCLFSQGLKYVDTPTGGRLERVDQPTMLENQSNNPKSLKERIGCEADCTIKQEWSEYDEKMLLELSQCCDLNKTQVQWLLSLKDRVQPQPEQGLSEENERIKKWLICLLNEMQYHHCDDDREMGNKALAWLEKQSQVKEFPISQHKNKTCKENDDSLTSEDERIGKAITEFFKNYSKNGTWKAIPNITKWIAWLENKIEQKEDKPPFNDPKYLAGFDIGREVQKIFDEQKPWSEEDERIIDRLCEILYACHSYGKCGLKLNEYSNLYDWLKSLRPQSTWKPSEGQMVALNCAITAASDDLVCLNVKDLKSLYEQLKKLKG